MIAKLRGVLDSVGEGSVILDVGGVGYLVYCSSKTLSQLPPQGKSIALIIESHIREDHIHLYGFLDEVEREWFRILTSVQGVGAKVGLGILSVLTPNLLSDAILSQDKSMVSRAPGVGPKLAARVISELRDKVVGLEKLPVAVPLTIDGEQAHGKVEDAVSALTNLGYQRGDAYGAIKGVVSTIGDDPAVEELIRAGLKELTG